MAENPVTSVTDDTQTPINTGDAYLGNPTMYEASAWGTKEEGFLTIRGFVNSDQAGVLDIYQGTPAQVNAITKVAPAAGTGDSEMKLDTFAFAVGAGVGTAYNVPLVSQAVRVRFTNNSGMNQTKFNLHFKLCQT